MGVRRSHHCCLPALPAEPQCFRAIGTAKSRGARSLLDVHMTRLGAILEQTASREMTSQQVLPVERMACLRFIFPCLLVEGGC